jgi:XTP/dITP diphosphohydrolase
MLQLFVATNNKGKQKEIRALLSDLPVEIIVPSQFAGDLKVVEDGRTYKENAQKKALTWSAVHPEIPDILTLADDSGLEVEPLQGLPGIHSARFSEKPGATDADRRGYLLSRLANYPRPWIACFRCVVALYDPAAGLHFSEGICHGEIIPEERGFKGFGYDPIFLVEGLDRTMAELSMSEKNKLSHRGRAIQAMKPVLVDIINR